MRLLSILCCLFLLLMPVMAADPVTDDALYDQVRIRLANDREVGGHAIDVKVHEGVVELTGKVKTEKLRAKAEKVAKKVKGVKSVVNKITIAPV